jgi:hypothetical protein
MPIRQIWIKARARFPLLLYEFAKTGQDNFAGTIGPMPKRVT